MNDQIRFNNSISYMIVSPLGEVEMEGLTQNQTGALVKDRILSALTTAAGASPGTITAVNYMGFRTDGSAILGSVNQWYVSGTAISTRYNSATYLNSVNFNGTYTATANTTVKTVALLWANSFANGSDMGSFAHFYSTNLNMSVGSAGKIIIQWTVSA